MARWLARPLLSSSPIAPDEDNPIALSGQTLVQLERLSFLRRQRATAGPGGEHRSRGRAPSTDFVDYRPYQPGDDFRRVDWSVYGRLDTLQIRLTEARERLELHLLVDCSASMRWGEPDKLVYAARVASALGYVALGRFDAVRVLLLGEEQHALGPLRGRARYHELARFLADVAPGGRIDLDQQIGSCLPRRFGTARRGQPLVVLISDLLAPGGLESGTDALLREGADVVVVHVLSRQEEQPIPSGEVELIDAESGESLEVGLSVEAVARYRERFVAWLDQIERFHSGRGLRYVRTRTDRPVDLLLLDDLRRGGVLR